MGQCLEDIRAHTLGWLLPWSGPELNLSASRATSAPEASFKLDAIESGYAVPLTRLNLHVWCIDLSIRPRRSAPRAREIAEQAQSIERERSKEPTDPLLWADEASSRAAPIAFGARGKSPNGSLLIVDLVGGMIKT